MSHSRKVMTSQKSDIHYTPAEVIDLVHEFWPQGIDLDPASDEVANQLVKARRIYTENDGGCIQLWKAETVFMNPPYSMVKQFMRRLDECLQYGDVKQAITLTKNDISTEWFQVIWDRADAICFVDHRLRFGDMKTGAPFCSVLAYYGPDSHRFSCLFSRLGPVVTQWQKAP